MWELVQELFDIFGNNEQSLQAFGESVGVFGDEQQAVLCVFRARKEIPTFVFLELTSFDATDLLERKEQAIVQMTRSIMDADATGGDDICYRRAEEQCIAVKDGKTHEDEKDL